MKIRPVAAEFFHADGRTWRRDVRVHAAFLPAVRPPKDENTLRFNMNLFKDPVCTAQ
jgi:hypothetical protein